MERLSKIKHKSKKKIIKPKNTKKAAAAIELISLINNFCIDTLIVAIE